MKGMNGVQEHRVTRTSNREIIAMRHNSWLRTGAIGLFVLALVPITAAAQTLERIRSAGVLQIGYVSDAAPFSSQGPGGSAVGYSIELCQTVVEGISSRLDMTNLVVNYTATSVEAGLEKIADGSLDLLCGSTTDTLKRRETVAFSIPIYNGGIGVLLRKNAPSELVRVLEGKLPATSPVWRATIRSSYTFAVHAGTVTEEWLRQRIATVGANITVVEVDSHEAGVEQVAAGRVDAYVADRAILRGYSHDQKDLVVLARYFTFEPIALALGRNDDDFRLVVDTALSNLYRSDAFEPLYSKHFGEPGEVTLMLFRAYARQ